MIKFFLAAVFFVIATSLSSRAQFISADVGVDGLTCSLCSKGTEVTLKKLAFVDTIWVDLNDLVAHIRFKKDTKVSMDDVRKMIEDAGFTVRSIKAVFNFDHTTVGKDYHFVYQGDTYHFIGADSKTLSGPVTLRFVDKQYVSKKEFTSLAKMTSLDCYKKGKAAMCCEGDYKVTGTLYHVSL
ncbi:MAG TPA: heavy metal-associated domain-containing protein [Candidatus Kapabacteria bacterium]|nr:heavy metal-associated domain-containing protein [Candidatus Kapabacteria bacterium]